MYVGHLGAGAKVRPHVDVLTTDTMLAGPRSHGARRCVRLTLAVVHNQADPPNRHLTAFLAVSRDGCGFRWLSRCGSRDRSSACGCQAAATPSRVLIPAMMAPPNATEANELRKPVRNSRHRIQASVSSSKATVAAATSNAARYWGMRNGSV